ncbi:MAG: hypothetical protein ACYC7A_17805 [Thermoanaerobaculia bacterium]
MKIVRIEYRRNGDGYKAVGFVTHTEVESAGYVPVPSQEAVVLSDDDHIWLFETPNESFRPRRTWFGELRAGCDHCLAPAEYHTGTTQTIGDAPGSRGHVICKAYRE